MNVDNSVNVSSSSMASMKGHCMVSLLFLCVECENIKKYLLQKIKNTRKRPTILTKMKMTKIVIEYTPNGLRSVLVCTR